MAENSGAGETKKRPNSTNKTVSKRNKNTREKKYPEDSSVNEQKETQGLGSGMCEQLRRI
jgi:hypothetical protein